MDDEVVTPVLQKELDKGTNNIAVPLILYFLGWTIVMGFFVLMGVLMFLEVPQANIGSVNQLFGTLATSFGTVVGFFFGASMGGRRKDELLAKVLKKS